ncbi:MAG: S8 family serine peptidase, partial [Mycobacteriales bacterium]
AGIILGRDSGVALDATYKTSFVGMAPSSRLVSLKVADARGATDVTQVLAAIDWVVAHRNDRGMNIRVLNLSFGTDSTQSYQNDPLAQAVEVAWANGITVVTSAGNGGNDAPRLTLPAVDPFVIAVGASDSNGTIGTGDDTVAAFSSRGDGVRNPDLVAPGRSIQSLRVPGSFIDAQYGSTGAINDRFFRGSGTSQSAALVSGAAALLISQRPSLTPDQVKGLLVSSAKPMANQDARSQGAGLLDLSSAMQQKATASLSQSFQTSSGEGSVDASRGSMRLSYQGVVLDGERDIHGKKYNAKKAAKARGAVDKDDNGKDDNGKDKGKDKNWSGGSWNDTAWTGSSWGGSSWAGSSWAGSSWAGSSWAGSSWARSSWSSGTWTGSSWANSNWAGSSWAGSSWAGSSWAGSSWAGSSWAGSSWASGSWS